MFTLAGKKGNSTYSSNHSTAIEGSKVFFESLSKLSFPHRVKLGKINNKDRPKSYFINCTVHKNSLEFKIGFKGVQLVTVTTSANQEDFLQELQKNINSPKIKVRKSGA